MLKLVDIIKKNSIGVAVAGALSLASSTSGAVNLEGTLWEKVSDKVDPYLLYAVALTESKRVDKNGKSMRPWPWSANIRGKGYFFDSREEAEKVVTEHLSRGVKNIDIGPLQVNVFWHGDKVKNPLDLFDLETSINVAADILSVAINSSPEDIAVGVGRYHNWKDKDLARKYGSQVLRYREAILRSRGMQ